MGHKSRRHLNNGLKMDPDFPIYKHWIKMNLFRYSFRTPFSITSYNFINCLTSKRCILLWINFCIFILIWTLWNLVLNLHFTIKKLKDAGKWIIWNGHRTKFDHKYTSKASASGELIKAFYILVSAKQNNNINLKTKLETKIKSH